MGIPGLWDILGDGEITAIADLSSEHFRRTGRPLRLAVDEAGWRFNNLTKHQVAFILEKEPAANPIEKAIMFRLLRMMCLNIQFIFIFDGPGRPWKRGGVAGRIDWKEIDLLRKLLDHLRIPHHRAPAEAEAECARLQELGIVDGVYSDDSDTLMFGCTLLVRDHRLGTGKSAKKSDTHVRVYRADKIHEKYGLDRAGLVMFALLSGGDYDTKGLEGCGPVAAHQAAKYDNGRLGQMLMAVPLRSLDLWAEELRQYFLYSASRGIVVPATYPRDLHVRNYRSPKVSTPEECNSLRGLQLGWNMEIDEGKLRVLLRDRFNIWTKGYIKHIVPVLLVRALASTAFDGVGDNVVFDIKLVPRRGKATQEVHLYRKIIFNPQVCTKLDLMTQPDGEDWTKFTGKDGVEFDPSTRAETETLDCVLERGLGTEAMQALVEEANQPVSRKRKSKATDGNQEEVKQQTKPAPKKRKSQATNVSQESSQQEPRPALARRGPKSTQAAASEADPQFQPTATSTISNAKSKSQNPAETAASLSAAAAKERQDWRTSSQPRTLPDQPQTRPEGFRLPTAFSRLSSNEDLDARNEPPAAPRASTSADTGIILDLTSDDEEQQLPTPPPVPSPKVKAKEKATKKSAKPVTGLPSQEDNRENWDRLALSLRKVEDDFKKPSRTFVELTMLVLQQSRNGGGAANIDALHSGLMGSRDDIRRQLKSCRNEMRMGAGLGQSYRDVKTLETRQKSVSSIEGYIQLLGKGIEGLSRLLGKGSTATTSTMSSGRSTNSATERITSSGPKESTVQSSAHAQPASKPSLSAEDQRHAARNVSGNERSNRLPATARPNRENWSNENMPIVEQDAAPSPEKTREAIARARLRHFQSVDTLPASTSVTAAIVTETSVRAPKAAAEVIDLT